MGIKCGCEANLELEINERNGIGGCRLTKDESDDEKQQSLDVPGERGELGASPFEQGVWGVVGYQSHDESEQDPAMQVWVVGGECRDLLQHGPCFSERLRAEENPSQADIMEGQQDEKGMFEQSPSRGGKYVGTFCSTPSLPGSGHAEQAAVQEAPEHELPPRAVPKTAQQHGDHEIFIRVERAVPRTTQRDVEVIAKPG